MDEEDALDRRVRERLGCYGIGVHLELQCGCKWLRREGSF